VLVILKNLPQLWTRHRETPSASTAIHMDTAQGDSISEHCHPYGPTPIRGQARQEHVSLGKSTDASCLHFHNTEEPSHA